MGQIMTLKSTYQGQGSREWSILYLAERGIVEQKSSVVERKGGKRE